MKEKNSYIKLKWHQSRRKRGPATIASVSNLDYRILWLNSHPAASSSRSLRNPL